MIRIYQAAFSEEGLHSTLYRYFTYKIPLVLACMFFVIYDDYRLDIYGLRFSLSGLILLGIARALCTAGVNDLVSSRQSLAFPNVKDCDLSIALPIGLLITCIWAFRTEDIYLAMSSLTGIGMFLLVTNVVSSALGILLGGPLTSFAEPPSNSLACPLIQDLGWSPICTSSVATFAVIFAFPFIERTFLSPLQVLSFTIAVIVCIGPQRLSLALTTPVNSFHNIRGHKSPRSILLQSAFVSVFVATLTATTMLWNSFPPAFIAGKDFTQNTAQEARLDLHYVPEHSFDIVISMYHEDQESVGRLASAIKDLPAISQGLPRVIIYTKDESANATLIQDTTGADVVERLENRGREGATYLHHIISRWNALAEHTLFIQADVRDSPQFISRIRDYFRPATGMLSLGFPGESCDCQACEDRYGWRDSWNLVPRIYEDVYNATCTRALLLYKGQFIVSARRIRGIEPRVYQSLHDALTNPDSWAHTGRPDADTKDSLNAPFVGYTIERLWGILMQCSDMELKWLCPSHMSGKRRGGSAKDCQCFDEIP